MHQVDPHSLFLGHIGDAQDVESLIRAGIRTVVDLAGNELPVALPRELTSLRFPLVDGGDNPRWLLSLAIESVARLVEQRVSTLVYCSAGMSRTPAIAAAALARATGRSLDDALAVVTKDRPHDVSPVLWADVVAYLAPRQ